MHRNHLALILAGSLMACTGRDTTFINGTTGNANLAGSGKLEVIPADGVVWEGVVPGYPCSAYVRVDSVGLEPLNIEQADIVDSGGGVFSLPTPVADLTVQPDDHIEFVVQALLSSLTTATGELRIKSNDEDTVDLRLPLTANPSKSWDTGDTGTPPC
ncbi:MAG: hypothetical protein GXP62_20115 [Oligoflexia bacterium]|nr:hypothetical protein [Oligoflexia bacterium]